MALDDVRRAWLQYTYWHQRADRLGTLAISGRRFARTKTLTCRDISCIREIAEHRWVRGPVEDDRLSAGAVRGWSARLLLQADEASGHPEARHDAVMFSVA